MRTKVRFGTRICLAMALVLVLTVGAFALSYYFGTIPVARAATDDAPFMVFDDYDTAEGSAGRDSAIHPGQKMRVLEQMLTFTQNPSANAEMVDEHFAPGAYSTRSLKISVGNDAYTPFYNQGQLRNNNHTNAKYVKIYVKNTSGKEAGYGIYLTDVPQSTLDGTAPSVDYGQEHWQLKWNAAVVLETLTGETSVVVSNAGLGILLPKDFVGSVNIPINSDTLAVPGWYLSQNVAASNQEIDMDRIYSVNSVIPANNGGASYLLGEIWMMTDNKIADILSAYYGEVAAEAEKVIRPVSTDFTVDYEGRKIEFPYAVDYKTFLSSFSIPSGYEVVVKDMDGFTISGDDTPITSGSTVVFTDGKNPYTFSITVAAGGETEKSGCGSFASGSTALFALMGAAGLGGVVLFVLRRRGKRA